MKSLNAQNSILADAHEQIEIIEHGRSGDFALVPFQQKLEQSNLYPLKPVQVEIFQVNIGKMCNQTCRHCHVDAGPDREEIMTKETMQQCLHALKNNPNLKTVDHDHINLLYGNPLSGKNYDELGSRFPDMSEPYDLYLKSLLQQKANEVKIDLKKGVYAAVNGPNLETKAEYRYLKIIGADMVGMSTVPEVIAANHMQLPCAAVSVITDECDPDNLKLVNIQEIIEVAGKADEKLSTLFHHAIMSL